MCVCVCVSIYKINNYTIKNETISFSSSPASNSSLSAGRENIL